MRHSSMVEFFDGVLSAEEFAAEIAVEVEACERSIKATKTAG